jgi:hypothetical protein
LTSSAAGRRGVRAHLALAAGERLHEGAQVLPAWRGLVFAGDEHQLVVGRDTGLIDGDHERVLVQQAQLDRLVVPEAAERRVDLPESIAGIRLKPTFTSRTSPGSRGRIRAPCAARPSGRRCRRCRPLAREVATLATCLPGSAMIEVSGRWTSAPIETSFRPGRARAAARAHRRSPCRPCPAASSFSGSAGSAGVSGRLTFRPTARKSPLGDRRVERRVIGVGEEVEHHREALGPAADRVSCLLPQAPSASRAREAQTSRSSVRASAAGGAVFSSGSLLGVGCSRVPACARRGRSA